MIAISIFFLSTNFWVLRLSWPLSFITWLSNVLEYTKKGQLISDFRKKNISLAVASKWDKKWVLVCQNFGVRTVRVKLELTDFNRNRFQNCLGERSIKSKQGLLTWIKWLVRLHSHLLFSKLRSFRLMALTRLRSHEWSSKRNDLLLKLVSH